MEAYKLKSTAPAPGLRLWAPPGWLLQLIPAACIAFLWMMMPAGPAAGQPQLTAGNFNYRIPPAWAPEQDHHYSFRACMTGLAMLIMITYLQSHHQCAAIIMRLGGAAREVSRTITPQVNGGVRNGVQLGPVAYLAGALQVRNAALEEESRLTSMAEFLAFTRKPGESINALMARYETVRQRAAIAGQFVMSVAG